MENLLCSPYNNTLLGSELYIGICNPTGGKLISTAPYSQSTVLLNRPHQQHIISYRVETDGRFKVTRWLCRIADTWRGCCGNWRCLNIIMLCLHLRNDEVISLFRRGGDRGWNVLWPDEWWRTTESLRPLLPKPTLSHPPRYRYYLSVYLWIYQFTIISHNSSQAEITSTSLYHWRWSLG